MFAFVGYIVQSNVVFPVSYLIYRNNYDARSSYPCPCRTSSMCFKYIISSHLISLSSLFSGPKLWPELPIPAPTSAPSSNGTPSPSAPSGRSSPSSPPSSSGTSAAAAPSPTTCAAANRASTRPSSYSGTMSTPSSTCTIPLASTRTCPMRPRSAAWSPS